MNALTRFVLDHKRLVLGFWLAVTIAAFAAIGPAGSSLSQQFDIPGREGFETNSELAAIYGAGGDVAPIVPVVTLPEGKTVDSPGVRAELDAALSKVEAALPESMSASFASTGDRAFVSDDGRTTFALVYIPAEGWRRPRAGGGPCGASRAGGRHRRRIPGRGDRARRTARLRRGQRGRRRRRRAGDAAGGAGRAARPRLRLPFVHGPCAAVDGAGRDPDDVPAGLAARERDRRLGDRPVPRRLDRARDRDRLRAPRRRPLARGAAAAGRHERDGGAERDAARRYRRRLQRHHRGDLVARAARSAGAVHAQHRRRRADDRAGQRRRGRHVAAGRAGDDRAEVRLAAEPTRRAGESWLVGLGASDRAPPLARSRRLDRCAGRAGGRGHEHPAREPARRLALEGRARTGRPREPGGLRHRHRPALALRRARSLRRPRRCRAGIRAGRRCPQRRSTCRLAPRRHGDRRRDPDCGWELAGGPRDARPPARRRARRCRPR